MIQVGITAEVTAQVLKKLQTTRIKVPETKKYLSHAIVRAMHLGREEWHPESIVLAEPPVQVS